MGNNLTTRLQARFAVVLCLLVWGCSAFAKTPVEQAIDFLNSDEPEKAKLILDVEVSQNPSAIAYANLAATNLALKYDGEAAYAFEMARTLGGFPKSEVFKQNLQKGLPAELRSLSDGPLRKVIQPLLRGLPDNASAAISLFSGLLACFLGLAFLFREGLARRRAPRLVLMGLVVFCLLGLVLAKAQSNYRMPSSGVVMKSTQLYEAPSTQSPRMRSLPEGAIVTVGELLSGTYRVTLPTGKKGWVPEGDIRVVKLSQLP